MSNRNSRHGILAVLGFAMVLARAPEACIAEGKTSSRPGSGGVVYFIDGAGGGGLVADWGRGVKRGLEQAGYRGDFRRYEWQTQLGPLVDHATSKRDRAAVLANRIRDHIDAAPGDPIHLIGLSSGAALLIYTLEALPSSYQVETAILLSPSLDAHYDLTRALPHVRSGMYVFTSKQDAILNTVVPMFGTEDGSFGWSIAGLRGFRLPDNASERTRRLYARMVTIAWRSDFIWDDNWGGHTDATNSRFVRRHLAPLLMTAAKEGAPMRSVPGASARKE